MTARPSADPSVAPREAPTDAVLAELWRLAEKATPGPWPKSGVRVKFMVGGRSAVAHAVGPDGDEVALVFYQAERHQQTYADALYIAAANPQAVLSVLDALAAAREALAQYGEHRAGCAGRHFKPAVCICGFHDAARAHLPQARAAEEGERAEREKIRKEIEDDVMAGRGFPKIKCEHKWVGSRYDGRRLHCEYCGIMEAAPRAE